MFVVTEETYQNKKDLLKRFLAAYRDSAAWIMKNRDEAAALAVNRAIDGKNQAINREVIQLRNLSSVSTTTNAHGLGAFDMAVLQKAADTYKELGIIQRDVKISDVVQQDLLPQK
jgi:NitT/TauT family transport system substrate-binding protein